MQENYDVIIVGGGVAGMNAAITAESEGLRTLLIERDENGCGGQAGESTAIENYFGFPDGITGAELAERGVAQAKKFGTDFLVPASVIDVQQADGKILIKTDDGTIFPTRTAILGLGISYSLLEVEGVSRLIGHGVKYGSPQVKESYEGNIVVVGGANSSGQAVMYLCRQPKCQVHMLVRKDGMPKMSAYLVDRINKAPNIQVHYQTRVKELRGITKLDSLLVSTPNGDEVIEANQMFIDIGGKATTAWLPQGVARDVKGYIFTGNDIPIGYWKLSRPPFFLETSIPGVFAAGDVRHNSTKRIPSASAEGVIAVQNIHRYLSL